MISNDTSPTQDRPPQPKHGFVDAPKQETGFSIVQFINNLPPLSPHADGNGVHVQSSRKKGLSGSLVWNRYYNI